VTATLTPQQIAILRRLDAGLDLPAYVLRPRNCAQDVELLSLSELVACEGGRLRPYWLDPNIFERSTRIARRRRLRLTAQSGGRPN
jgi:hypothetical protein